jgi:hypothetical protein
MRGTAFDAVYRLRPWGGVLRFVPPQADADLQAIIKVGRGDVPLTELRFCCSQCGTDRTDFVVTGRDVVLA